MIAGILAIVAALIGFFTSKKAGANDATAAAVGLAAGGGTYWAATQTDWGKATVDKIDGSWKQLFNKDGTPAKDENGNTIHLPAGITPVEGGGYTDGKGGFWDNVGDVLKDWGPAGTAGVVGGGIVASKFKFEPWMALAGLGVLALVVLK